MYVTYHAFYGVLLRTHTKGSGTGLIPVGGGIFRPVIGMVPIQHEEEFGKLLICSGNSEL